MPAEKVSPFVCGIVMGRNGNEDNILNNYFVMAVFRAQLMTDWTRFDPENLSLTTLSMYNVWRNLPTQQ